MKVTSFKNSIECGILLSHIVNVNPLHRNPAQGPDKSGYLEEKGRLRHVQAGGWTCLVNTSRTQLGGRICSNFTGKIG
jgi:hypothetical protein